MLDVTYIGRLMVDLDLEQEAEQLSWRSNITDVASLIELLCSERGAHWSTAFQQENLLISVNQSMVKKDHMLTDGDVIIFFPPIAGG